MNISFCNNRVVGAALKAGSKGWDWSLPGVNVRPLMLKIPSVRSAVAREARFFLECEIKRNSLRASPLSRLMAI